MCLLITDGELFIRSVFLLWFPLAKGLDISMGCSLLILEPRIYEQGQACVRDSLKSWGRKKWRHVCEKHPSKGCENHRRKGYKRRVGWVRASGKQDMTCAPLGPQAVPIEFFGRNEESCTFIFSLSVSCVFRMYFDQSI